MKWLGMTAVSFLASVIIIVMKLKGKVPLDWWDTSRFVVMMVNVGLLIDLFVFLVFGRKKGGTPSA